MPTFVSLLRGINVGGHNKIRMADLRRLYTSLGMDNTRTLLQSGNVVFETADTDLALVKSSIEAGIRRTFDLDIPVILRSAAAFGTIFQRHPFTEEQLGDAKKVAVAFLSGVPEIDVYHALRDSNPGRELIHADGRELFIFYADGMARSKLDTKRIDSKLGLIATVRNWNTCMKLQQILADFEA